MTNTQTDKAHTHAIRAHTVAVVMDAAGKHRCFPHADDFDNSRLWGTGDLSGRHRMYWYYSGVTSERALELAAYNAAALCLDFTALEVEATR